ncbi:hypothetical protein OE749_05315 [Aestuariibacter sp. AA17]|uniref:Uncharacterized protein n=1 Tax=Fluctibacter corallii TaxID=2984329 RepID=A0ABT3A615_9ALTE|nr:hypothetical protein [Aestuariibacter sp. AA17]MCV2884104.1 hypothetical protein [Aestuariibacter sp. AA17]
MSKDFRYDKFDDDHYETSDRQSRRAHRDTRRTKGQTKRHSGAQRHADKRGDQWSSNDDSWAQAQW